MIKQMNLSKNFSHDFDIDIESSWKHRLEVVISSLVLLIYCTTNATKYILNVLNYM